MFVLLLVKSKRLLASSPIQTLGSRASHDWRNRDVQNSDVYYQNIWNISYWKMSTSRLTVLDFWLNSIDAVHG
ncbi:hypothetical protein PAHAL_2G250400 [Panicum hallii]|uniref:Uncharacterized protein n=1 Tax=Panicum hallii TaxID=206008 RepID=A0A2T8KQC8_9POAL|nr:hypothetical protein PAHAL_2G250400 [Panicum hallii]